MASVLLNSIRLDRTRLDRMRSGTNRSLSKLIGFLTLLIVHSLFSMPGSNAQEILADKEEFTRADRLRGSINEERSWWDLQHYELDVQVFPETRSLKGSNKIRFRVLENGSKMQIDLQEPLKITSVIHGEKTLKFEREGNAFFVKFETELTKDTEETVEVFYEGKPVVAVRPPWNGGITWQKDELGNDFIATACQGIGASVWWPCKDHGYDEPDQGMTINATVPDSLVAVCNGRLSKTTHDETAKTKTYQWVVTQPINNYGVNMNIGNYVSFSEKFQGEGGELDVQYWVLDHQREKAEKHFKEAPRTLKAFEYWFGKYPFYEDSFKLVVVPYLGMEHQSSVTYGNGFQNGYRGRDLSNTGVGMKFDFIIVHESGHEWWGNNVSMKDAADMWIHESFTNYSENLFVEYHFSEKEAQDYVIGCRQLVGNKSPIIGVYGVNKSGSGDMYYKGGNMLHTIRHIINDDEKWRLILRGLNQKFWHQTVTTKQVEDYISSESGFEFEKYFDQYLRGTKIPVLKYTIDKNLVRYHFEDVVEGLSFRVKVRVNGEEVWITPTSEVQELKRDSAVKKFELDRNFYVDLKRGN